jgi:hypothetical protein
LVFGVLLLIGENQENGTSSQRGVPKAAQNTDFAHNRKVHFTTYIQDISLSFGAIFLIVSCEDGLVSEKGAVSVDMIEIL